MDSIINSIRSWKEHISAPKNRSGNNRRFFRSLSTNQLETITAWRYAEAIANPFLCDIYDIYDGVDVDMSVPDDHWEDVSDEEVAKLRNLLQDLL